MKITFPVYSHFPLPATRGKGQGEGLPCAYSIRFSSPMLMRTPPREPASEGAPLPNLLPAGGEKEQEVKRISEFQEFDGRTFSGNSLTASLPASGERGKTIVEP